MNTPLDPAERMNRLADLMENDPSAAADELDRQIAALTALASRLRARAAMEAGRGGCNDRVQMRVVGPGGDVRQCVDTGAVGGDA